MRTIHWNTVIRGIDVVSGVQRDHALVVGVSFEFHFQIYRDRHTLNKGFAVDPLWVLKTDPSDPSNIGAHLLQILDPTLSFTVSLISNTNILHIPLQGINPTKYKIDLNCLLSL